MPIEFDDVNKDIDSKSFQGTDDEVEQGQDMFSPNDMAKLIKTYMEEKIPKKLEKSQLFQDFWIVFSNTAKLTFLDNQDIEEIEMEYNKFKVNYMMSKPAYKFSWEDMMQIDMLWTQFKLSLKRSVGTQAGKINERLTLGQSVVQTIRSNTERSGGGSQKKGFFGF